MKSNSTLFLFSLLSVSFFFTGCKKDPETPNTGNPSRVVVPAEAQRTGDPIAGREYLLNGNYISSGIPLALFTQVIGSDPENVLNRSGDNATIPPEFTAIDADNGVRVVAANCMQCHGQKIKGDYILGLGNSLGDFTNNGAALMPLIDAGILALYGPNSDEAEAFSRFRRGTMVTGPNIITEVVGANPADKLTQVLVAHRDPQDLSWLSDAQFPYDTEVIPTDVPAWWLMAKKNAEFYTGSGRGDHAKISTAAALLTMTDSSEARSIDQNAANVMAFIKSIEPPLFPEATDPILVEEGKMLFENNCATCHGNYGQNESYPNYIVALDDVGTDPALAEAHFALADFENWYNQSWYATTAPAARFETEGGYVAPPLDGVWATAPYLHNGSIPNLWTLLKSSDRPTFWRRSMDNEDYDLSMVGWEFTEESSKTDVNTYDTQLLGYGNQGHNFGDGLSDAQRIVLIEYLKTL